MIILKTERLYLRPFQDTDIDPCCRKNWLHKGKGIIYFR